MASLQEQHEHKQEEKTTRKKVFDEWDDVELLKPTILRGIYAYGFEHPSPIQKRGIIPMIEIDSKGKRHDIIAQAQSGTGKTGCFTIGALNIVDTSKPYTQALIMAPTHELASQILNVVNDIGSFDKVVTQLLIGGTSVDGDRSKLDSNPPHIVVGTPGRVHDMIRRNYLKTDKMELIVLDEADEMLSQGFKEQIYKIFQYMPSTVQIGLFSATMPPELNDLTSKFMNKPTKILVKAEQLTLRGIAQYFIRLPDDAQKYNVLQDIFSGLTVSQAIIYCNSVSRVDDLHEAMVADEFPVHKIHGKMEESERKKIYKQFQEGNFRVLITSDLFARGIDIQQVEIVINFDIPKCEHTYLHRIGRSGRWGRKGIAINFITKRESARIKHFEEYYSTEIKEMPSNWTAHINNV